MERLTPPPVRRIAIDRQPRVVPPTAPAGGEGNGAGTALAAWPGGARGASGARRRGAQPALSPPVERMRIESVSLAYGERWVVRDVSLPVRRGEVLALIGASGSGKTTLLRSLNRLTEITAGAGRAGRIALDGEEIHEIEVNALRRRVTMVFQQPNPFPMSVFDNVAYVLREQAKRRPRRAALRPQVEEALAHAGLLEEVKDNLDHPALRRRRGRFF